MATFSQTFADDAIANSAAARRLGDLIAPCDDPALETMAQEAAALTRQKFGKTVRLFAPLYVSNECVNNCSYCGFSRDNPILRVTLTVDQVVAEAQHLYEEGFRNVLLVAGEHPKFVSEGYLEECIAALRETFPTLALEVGPMETPEYRRMVEAGCEGLVVYQETYDREAYREYHTAGPKKDFDWRLDCPERAYAAGFRRLGIGALMGLADPVDELLALAAHLDHLQRNCWKASLTVALPRLRPAAGGFRPRTEFSDRELVQAVCALRIVFPEVGFVLSTREPAALRDAMLPLGVTHMSAGSQTDPGGYTGAGNDDLHLTVRGRRVEAELEAAPQMGDGAPTPCTTSAEGQFDISDERSASELVKVLRERGFDPVWKDWDASILSPEVVSPTL